jgi:hypothetical protein
VTAAAQAHEGLIRSETLAVEVAYGAVSDGVGGKVGEGTQVGIGLQVLRLGAPGVSSHRS